jgi:hypothetical protein
VLVVSSMFALIGKKKWKTLVAKEEKQAKRILKKEKVDT